MSDTEDYSEEMEAIRRERSLNKFCRKRLEILGVVYGLKRYLEITDPECDFEDKAKVMLRHLKQCDDYVSDFINSLPFEDRCFCLDNDLLAVVTLASVYVPDEWYISDILRLTYDPKYVETISMAV